MISVISSSFSRVPERHTPCISLTPHRKTSSVCDLSVVERLDRTVAGIITTEQTHHVIENGFDQRYVITGAGTAENCGRLDPDSARVAVGEQAVDLGGCRNVFHFQIISALIILSIHSILFANYIT